jgi:alpha-tubulin suppressor-like RCC1 family protein
LTQVELAPTYAACVSTDGSLFAWGENKFHQLGLGIKEEVIASPRQVLFPDGVKIT